MEGIKVSIKKVFKTEYQLTHKIFMWLKYTEIIWQEHYLAICCGNLGSEEPLRTQVSTFNHKKNIDHRFIDNILLF